MNGYPLHMNHPYGNALLLAGAAVIVVGIYLLTAGAPAPHTDEAVLAAANGSEIVRQFADSHPDHTTTVDHMGKTVYLVEFRAEDARLAVRVDMEDRSVTRLERISPPG